MISYYFKKISDQDKTKTAVINEKASEFFNVDDFTERDQERNILVRYPSSSELVEVRIVQKQDKRIFINRDLFNPDDIWIFEKIGANEYSFDVIKSNSPNYDTVSLALSSGFLITDTDPRNQTVKLDNKSKMSLNQILYGPPGTGKTYNTIIKSLQILSIDYTDYNDALDKFQQELGNRIEFVSMHQSFSYEDFVQGLRPRSLDGSIQFEYVDGVFKKICSRASEALTGDRSEVEDIQISISEIAEIAFFLSKFNGKKKDQKQGVHLLGYQSDDEAFRRIGEKIGIKPNSLKNHRDKFDFIFNDRLGYTSRKGWTPRNQNGELDNTGLWPYQDFYNEFNDFDINELSDRVLGILNKFDSAATRNPDGGNFVIVLDEINRANISKVFGELITLIEEDKRESFTVRLPSGDFFTVPSNLHIIGTMNTADKSVSMVDIALRRRFEFEAMYPNPMLVSDPKNKKFMIDLNKELVDKKGIDFQIGHSDFMNTTNLLDCINKKTIPLLMEYFRNRHEEVSEILSKCLPGEMELDSELLGFKLVKVNYKSH
jgi:5-methylcytosine-specific restriction protein B